MRSVFGASSSGERGFGSNGGSCSKTSIGGATERSGGERLGHRRLVEDAAAGDVEQQRRRLHHRQLARSDEPARAPGQRHVDGDGVGPAEQLVEADQLDAAQRGLLGRHVRVLPEDGHLHRPRPVRDGLADLAEAHDAQRLAPQLDAGQAATGRLPVAGPHGGIALGDPAGEPVEQRERVFGGRDRVAGRRVDDHDAGPRRRVEIDVVHADAGPADDDEPAAGGDERRIGLDLAADDERVVLADDRAQLVTRQAEPFIDLVVRAEEFEPLRGDRFRDEDLHPAALPRRPRPDTEGRDPRAARPRHRRPG